MLKTTASGFALALALTLTLAMPAAAAEFGTADDARSMLDHVVEAMGADEAGTIAKINAHDPSFVQGDIYPFCGGSDGMFTAHGANTSLIGTSLKDLKDKAGTALGEDIYSSAAEGSVSEVAYLWPRPGETDPTDKVAFVTKIGDQVCAVGYYK